MRKREQIRKVDTGEVGAKNKYRCMETDPRRVLASSPTGRKSHTDGRPNSVDPACVDH